MRPPAPTRRARCSTKRGSLLRSLVGICLLLAPLGGVACKDDAATLTSRKEAPTAASLSSWIGVWIPPSAAQFQSYAKGWQEWVVIAAFELPSSELATFLERNRLVPSTDPTPTNALQQPWFQPAANARAYRPADGSTGQPATGRFHSAFWIVDSVDSAKVYLRANDM